MLSKLDLNTVRVYAAVVDEQSFAGAARQLQLPASNVSRHVAALERSLGVRLLEQQHPPPAHDRGRPPAVPARQAPAGHAGSHRRGTGRRRTGITRAAAHVHARGSPLLLGPIIAEFCASHPGVELQCDTRMAGEQALREDMDLAIVFHRGDQDDSTLVTRELASLPSLVVGAPGLIARAGMPTRTAQLKTLPCITTLSALQGQPWRFVDTAGRMVKVPVRSRYRVNSGALALAGARQGIGYAILAAGPARRIWRRAGWWRCRWNCGRRPCSCWPCMAIGIRPARVYGPCWT